MGNGEIGFSSCFVIIIIIIIRIRIIYFQNYVQKLPSL